MVWENHYRLRDILLWIVMMISLSISHLFTRYFFGFPFLPRWMGDARAIKDVCDVFWWPNLVIHCFLGCAAVSFPIWRGTCRQIIIGLPPAIDYCVFSFFSLSWQLKCTLVLFVCCLSNQAWLTYSSILSVTWFQDPLPLGLVIMSDPSIWVKKINFFQKHN
jgi:hypothetical protein